MMRFFLACCLVLGFLHAPLYAQTYQSYNLNLLGQLNYSQNLNDIWGYVDDNGVEYALVGTTTGTSIVSLADPSNPVEIHFISGSTTIWRDLKTWGDFAYVTADQGTDGLLIIDLSDIENGNITHNFWRPTLTINGTAGQLLRTHNLYIDEHGYAYLSGSNVSIGETFFLDVHTTPGTPIFVGAAPSHYSHDCYVRGDTLWDANINDGFFTVYDVSNKANPVLLASKTTPHNFTHNVWLSDDGRTLFTTDEKPDAYTAAYDVSDLANIVETDRYQPYETKNTGVIPHNTHVKDQYLVISHYTDGVVVVDASRPDNLVEVGKYDTYTQNNAGGFNGAWGAYPFFDSDRILVSDINSGLYVFQPNYVQAAWLEGIVTSRSSGATLSGVMITLDTMGIFTNSTLDGSYKTGLGFGGPIEVTFSKLGYRDSTVTINLQNGVVSTFDIALEDAPQVTARVQIVDMMSNQPLTQAPVHIYNDEFSFEGQTDATGSISLTVFADEYQVAVGHWGHLSQIKLHDFETTPNVRFELERGYFDGFGLDLGWSVQSTASSGFWTRSIGSPVRSNTGDLLSPERDALGDVGDKFYLTGDQDNNSPGTDDVDGGQTILESPTFDGTSMTQPQLDFLYHFAQQDGINPADDSLSVWIFSGNQWVFARSFKVSNYLWAPASIQLENFVPLSNTMKIRFVTQDAPSSPNVVEAAIDKVHIHSGAAVSTQEVAPSMLNVAPNPFHAQLNIEWQAAAGAPLLQVYNTLGQRIEQRRLPAGTTQWQGGQTWPTGQYIIVIETAQKRQQVRVQKF